MHEITIETFQGPFSKLLELIEQEKLDITEVSLSQIADQYLSYIDGIEKGMRPEELADFLLIAAKLLVIKSHALLPSFSLEDGEEAGDLEHQLKIYRAYRDASRVIGGLIGKKRFSFVRLPVKGIVEHRFRAPENVTATRLEQIFTLLIKELGLTIVTLPQKSINKVVTITERINHLRDMFKSARKVGFGDFLKTAKNRSEVIVSFLALLEFVRQRSFSAEQEEGNDIVIFRT